VGGGGPWTRGSAEAVGLVGERGRTEKLTGRGLFGGNGGSATVVKKPEKTKTNNSALVLHGGLGLGAGRMNRKTKKKKKTSNQRERGRARGDGPKLLHCLRIRCGPAAGGGEGGENTRAWGRRHFRVRAGGTPLPEGTGTDEICC